MSDSLSQFVPNQVSVTLQSGQAETVKVRQFTMRDIPAVMDAWPNMVKVVEIACSDVMGARVPAGYTDMLTVDSFEALLDTVEEANASFFRVCARLARKTATMLGFEAPKPEAKPGQS